MRTLLAALILALMPNVASAELRIFACEPEWAALADEIGGALVETYSATTALQDPHYIQARPSLIAKVRRADLVICSGAQLEIGWLPALLRKANNPAVLPGRPGHFEASGFVERLDATGNVDRSQGDIHPQGNPHVQTNPHNIAAVATALGQRLGELDTYNSETYEGNLSQFLDEWRVATERWEALAAPVAGRKAIAHHKSWVYLEQWLGFEVVATLEPVAGLPPTATHLSRLTSEHAGGDVDFIIRSPYQDAKASVWLSERMGAQAIVLPLTVGGTDGAIDLFGLFDDIVERLLEALPDA
jgi:zinc/manganese transport system substrate-binding protein